MKNSTTTALCIAMTVPPCLVNFKLNKIKWFRFLAQRLLFHYWKKCINMTQIKECFFLCFCLYFICVWSCQAIEKFNGDEDIVHRLYL